MCPLLMLRYYWSQIWVPLIVFLINRDVVWRNRVLKKTTRAKAYKQGVIVYFFNSMTVFFTEQYWIQKV